MRSKCGDNAKNCPHCASRPNYLCNCSGTSWAVGCPGCGARGPWKQGRMEALNAWNRRDENGNKFQ